MKENVMKYQVKSTTCFHVNDRLVAVLWPH